MGPSGVLDQSKGARTRTAISPAPRGAVETGRGFGIGSDGGGHNRKPGARARGRRTRPDIAAGGSRRESGNG